MANRFLKSVTAKMFETFEKAFRSVLYFSLILTMTMVYPACSGGGGGGGGGGDTNDSSDTGGVGNPISSQAAVKILEYQFDEGSGTTVVDKTGNGYDGTLNGGATWITGGGIDLDGTDGYIELPDGLLSGLDSITVVIDVSMDASKVEKVWPWTFGSAEDAGSAAGTTYLALLQDGSKVLRGTISDNRWSNEQKASKGGSLMTDLWRKIVYTQSGSTSTLYINGDKVAENSSLTNKPKDMEPTIANYIGKPAYAADNYFKGKVRKFSVYNGALTHKEVKKISSAIATEVVTNDFTNLTLGDISDVSSDMTLPSVGEIGSKIVWTSSDTNYLSSGGKVLAPAHSEGDKIVQLTALITKGDSTRSKTFDVTVAKDPVVEQDRVDAAAVALTAADIPNSTDIRGNITLPLESDHRVTISWTAAPTGIISTETIPASSNGNYAPIPLGVVTRPDVSTDVTLTATFAIKDVTATKDIVVTVREKTTPITDADYAGYFFTYFTGESLATGEQIYFATSTDGLHWKGMNENSPVLTSDVGDNGVRDPYIIRSPEGDKFYMIATDLRIANGAGWGAAQTAGSKSIVVWESTDLVNWGDERLVQVARDDAGCTWAPEIVYDDKTGEYVVYWASRIGADNYAKQRIYSAKTRDFHTFTPAELFLERPADVIDSTIIKHNASYYRFSKDEVRSVVIMDTFTQILGNTIFNQITAPVVEAQSGVEGPAIFKLNNQDKWLLLVDQYGGKGYYPLATTNLASGVFELLDETDYGLPPGPRHGTVMPVTQAEYDAVMAKWYTQPIAILSYDFDEGSGTTVNDKTGNGYNGTLNGGTAWLGGGEDGIELNGTDAYVDMPDGMLSGLTSITVVADVLMDAGNVNPVWLWTFGSAENAASASGTTYLGLLQDGGGNLRATISDDRWSNEQKTAKGSSLTHSVWRKIVYTQSSAFGTMYIDGVKVASTKTITNKPQDMEAPTTIANFIGKPAYSADKYFKGKVRGFSIYNGALSYDEIKTISFANAEEDASTDHANLTLGDVSDVTADITLPQIGEQGSTISWTSSDTNYLSDDGKVTRPAHEDGPQTVQLTAVVKKGDVEKTKVIDVTIREQVSDQEKVDNAAAALSIPNSADIRGNITLPETAENGITITWAVSHAEIISTDTISAASNGNYAPIPLGVVTRPVIDTEVTLTATLVLNAASATKDITADVKAQPTPVTDADYVGYFFTYFTGEGSPTGEQIYFATSTDGLHWQALNKNTPVLTSDVGDNGVRDPYILRSPEGDKFYMIATDLRIANGAGWSAAQTAGSKSIVVWESTDLVNWSEERLVKVARDDAGCTWAPEIVYDDKTGEYVVYWASRIGADSYAKHRIYYAKTRDFHTFTPAELFLERPADVIDSTIIKHNGSYYRFSKDEVGKFVIMDSFTQILGNTVFNQINAPIVEAQTGVEGPAIFKLNGEDKWVLLLDNYGGSGYYPLTSTNLDSGVFEVLDSSEYELPPGPRHGTVMPVTQAEYDAVTAKWCKSFGCVAEQTDPVLSYNFDEGSGTSIGDSSNYSHDATLYGGVTWLAGGGIELDGVDDYVKLPDGLLVGSDSITVVIDVSMDATSVDPVWLWTFGSAENPASAPNTTYLAVLQDGGHNLRGTISDNRWSNEQRTSMGGPLTHSVWKKVVYTQSGTTGTLYVDGVQVAQNTSLTNKPKDMENTIANYLGKPAYPADRYLKAQIKGFNIYNRALSSAEVAALSP